MADDAVDTIAAKGIAALQAIIDEAEATTAVNRRAARANKLAQIATLREEVRALDASIDAVESNVVKRARARIEKLRQIVIDTREAERPVPARPR
jgi:hypothetical protein